MLLSPVVAASGVSARSLAFLDALDSSGEVLETMELENLIGADGKSEPFDVGIIQGQPEYLGPVRQLGFKKIADPVANIVRNATQAEIDRFVVAQDEDENAQEVEEAKKLISTTSRFSKVFDALERMVITNTNEIRTAVNLPQVEAKKSVMRQAVVDAVDASEVDPD